jgi:hypothetical protein
MKGRPGSLLALAGLSALVFTLVVTPARHGCKLVEAGTEGAHCQAAEGSATGVKAVHCSNAFCVPCFRRR